MFNMDNDIEYLELIDDILKNKEFIKTQDIEHHGTTRYDHSLRVSYLSYKISKVLKVDYIDSARAGLLHDFFLSDENRSTKERFVSTFIHPKISVENAIREFNINGKEMDIIRTHMFPINLAFPKYLESWVVSSVDKIVGTYEFSKKFKNQLSYATNFFIIFLLNNIK
ncbi:MAG: HD domain-containing protein [Bacilli bacterium]|nr:HD domain-containing protein [Bacilli bacterium]